MTPYCKYDNIYYTEKLKIKLHVIIVKKYERSRKEEEMYNIFDVSQREVRKDEKTVKKILSLEKEYKALSDEELKHKTVEFKERLNHGETLDDLMVEAFATVREASARVLHMRHFPVQLIGGMVLHNGDIAEMRTGEGKTLVATLPAYLNALTGEGVYVVTVNDYLASRDAEEMGQIYKFLGLTVGLIINDMEPDARRAAYNCDITYGTNNEFGFDYLRDNMAETLDEQVQRGLNYAIIDEVDSILIDEARTPLIISSSSNESLELYKKADAFVSRLTSDDYDKDIKDKVASLTEKGIAKAERYFHIDNLAGLDHVELAHAITQSLHAHVIMTRDIDYLVKDGEVIIVDEFTGRPMPGRRFSDGLHQAIEAKEHVRVNAESKTLATITLQNYFRMFNKIAGMTGTAKTEEEEFREIYNLNTIVIPTNKPVIRQDLNDKVFATEKGKFKAVVEEVKRRHATGQPVLIGTVSIEKSEKLSHLLKRAGIKHNVLNAKYLEKEADIVSLAGQKGAVTISTNMAGRGTDIKLGDGVAELGGLCIIGTERHESRRIDNQLRGRSGRQGDPGCTQFFVSLEDNLMKRFGPEKLKNFARNLGIAEDEPIESKMLTRSIESAQKKVEAVNFGIRKNVLAYDMVMNKQRQIIYHQRQSLFKGGPQIISQVSDMMDDYIDHYIDAYCVGEPEGWNFKGLSMAFKFLDIHEEDLTSYQNVDDLRDFLEKRLRHKANQPARYLDSETFSNLMRIIMLKNVDMAWMDHIDDMDQLRRGIGLRAYGQNDPVVAYTEEGFTMFQHMNERIREETVKSIAGISILPA